ncbi:cytochrome c [Oxalobacteraceae bacterium GrIS 1.11]
MFKRTLLKNVLAWLITLGLASSVFAADRGTPEEASAMVKKAVEFLKKNGKEKLLAEVSNPKGMFVDRDLYLSVYDFNGIVLAHGMNPKIIGKSVKDLYDVDGKFFMKDIITQARAAGKGRTEYKWPNPVTKEFQKKSAYFEAVDELIISCGYYIY